jgi:hypothetical protein
MCSAALLLLSSPYRDLEVPGKGLHRIGGGETFATLDAGQHGHRQAGRLRDLLQGLVPVVAQLS